MKANMYGTWYTIAQRPHHLAGVLIDAGWDVDVYTIRRFLNSMPNLFFKPNLFYKTLSPGPIKRTPLISNLAKRYDNYIEKKIFNEFLNKEADIYIHYNCPQEYSSTIGDLPGHFIYDCVDDFEGFNNPNNKDTYKWEERLCERADQIWVVSHHLANKLDKWGDKISYVPNGVDFDHFSKARELKLSMTDGVSNNRIKKLIYMGAIYSWFDAYLVGVVAELLSDWDIDLIGPCVLDSNQKRCLDKENIHFYGRKDYSELPTLLSGADVAMIPFKINQLIRGTSPIKLYEYLASGLPVVTTPMPEVIPYEEDGVVSCVESPEEFASAVRILAESYNQERCQHIAKESSWSARFSPVIRKLVPT